MNLTEVAQLVAGWHFKTGGAGTPCNVLLVRHILPNGRLNTSLPFECGHAPASAHRAKLAAGDVVLVARGAATRAAALIAEKFDALYASSNLLVVRPDPTKLLPEVLMSHLSNDRGQRQLTALSTGSVIPNLTGPALAQLTVPVPPMKVQVRIAKAWHAIQDAQAAAERALKHRQNLAFAVLANALYGSVNDPD